MSISPTMREAVYRAYMEFFEVAEKKRRWNMFDDIPWDQLDRSRTDEADAIRVETFCGVELYVPDYVLQGLNSTRSCFGQAWFVANWGYEESKHALVFREYLIRSGLRTQQQYDAYEDQIFSRQWQSPAKTMRQIAIYGAFQEIATYHIYHVQREKAQRDGNVVLDRIFHYVSRDEAAHCSFYRKVVALEMAEDPAGTLEDLACLLLNFQMPGAALIPEYHRRLDTEGVGLTKEKFMAAAIFPTLRQFGTTRAELMKVYRARQAREQAEGAWTSVAAA
jgi:acyl-[acyl-carrier-protein] desaturase